MIIWNYWPVPTGGAESQCRKLAKQLAMHQIQCTVLTARQQIHAPAREQDGSVDIVRVPIPQMWINRFLAWRDKRRSGRTKDEPSKGLHSGRQKADGSASGLLNGLVRWGNSLAFILGATFWLVRRKRFVDIIHVHIGDWIAGYAGWIGARLNVPVVCKAADSPALPYLHADIPLRGTWEAWRKKINYVALHAVIRDELNKGGIPENCISTIPNGVEIPLDKAEPEHGEDVLFVGNFSQGPEHKGFDVLLRAWAMVFEEAPQTRLVMVGAGESGQWRRMAGALRCSGTVEFRGYVTDIALLYQKSALFVLPSRHEGMSNALLEAQAWGLPAIVSDIPGNRAVVENDVTGLVVSVDDPRALADAMLELMADPPARAQMGRRARERTMERFSMERVAASYRELYGILLSRHQEMRERKQA